MIARRTGHREKRREDVPVNDSPTPVNHPFTLVRDWSSSVNGASGEGFTGPDNSALGCGPGGLIHDRHDSFWGTSGPPAARR